MIQLAGCIFRDSVGRVLLLRRCDRSVAQWESPGGKIEAGESAEQAVVRECWEELAVTVRIDHNLTTTYFVQDGLEFSYQWFGASIVDGEPVVQEPKKHDQATFIDLTRISDLDDPISPNLQSFIESSSIFGGTNED